MVKETSKYKAPTVAEIRTWSVDELTNLGWAYDKVRRAGHDKMLRQNWFNTLMKRVDIVRKEKGLPFCASS